MTITASIRQFLEYCEVERGKSVLTLRNYQFYLQRFLKWIDNNNANLKSQISKTEEKNKIKELEDQIVENTEDITQELVRQYRLYLTRLQDRKGEELKKQTQNYHIIALRAYLKFLASRGIPSLSPEKVELAKIGDRQITFLEQEEVVGLLDKVDVKGKSGLRDRAMLELLFSTGLRVSELASLKVEQLNLERGEMAVLGKGKKERVVFISDDAVEWLSKYLLARGDKLGPLFGQIMPNGERRQLSVRTVERIVKKYALKAGIVKNVSPHTIRHSFATDLLINGADIRSVQSLLGHSSITTTQVYTHLTDQRLREVHKAYHSRRRTDRKSE